MIDLFYAKIDLGDEDIKGLVFLKSLDLCEWIRLKCLGNNHVFLIGIESGDIDEVFVTSDLMRGLFILDKFVYMACSEVNVSVYFQEYFSFEEAYAVALDMKEPNPLCYSPDNDNDNED